MNDLKSLKPVQVDALREVANIGAGHAATALSQMTGSTIMISVPTITIAKLEDVPPRSRVPKEPVAAVLMHMMGDLTGRTLLVFPKATAVRLSELMLRRPAGSSSELGELEQSAIKEAGNILSGAYMNALSDFMGLMLLPSPPSLAVDMSSAVLTTAYLQFGTDRDYVFCVESEFYMTDLHERLRGFFLLLPDVASLQAILRRSTGMIPLRTGTRGLGTGARASGGACARGRVMPFQIAHGRFSRTPRADRPSEQSPVPVPSPRSPPRERDRDVLRSFAKRIDPSDAGAHNNLGVLYYNKGLLGEAVAAFSRALELDAKMQVAQRNIEIAYFNTGYYDRRVSELRIGCACRTTIAKRAGSWSVRTRCSARWTTPSRNSVSCCASIRRRRRIVQLGLAEKGAAISRTAQRWFARALALDPNSAVIQFYVGEVLYNRGLNDEALHALKRSIDLAPDNPTRTTCSGSC
jgi:chemotaxis protein CheC